MVVVNVFVATVRFIELRTTEVQLSRHVKCLRGRGRGDFGVAFENSSDDVFGRKQRSRLEDNRRSRAPGGLRNEAVRYKLRFGTYPEGPPFGSHRGHYPIVEFEIWPFQPRVKLSVSTMRPLIDIFSRCSCNVARSLAYLRTSSLSLFLPASLFLPSLRTSCIGPVQSRGPECLHSRTPCAVLPLDLF